jgi:sugar phosphate isomerase/epimerase
MAKIGVMTTEFDAPTFEEVVDQIASHQISCVQLQLGSAIRDVPTVDSLLLGLDVLGDKVTEDLAVRSRAVLDARGIEVAAVDGTYNMVHPDPERRARNLDRLVRLINLAHRFGTNIVTLCTGTRDDIMWHPHPDNQSTEAWADLLAQMRVAADAAETAGIHLAFEPEYNNVVNSAQQARRLIDEVGSPSLKVLMDGANLFHQGDLDRMQDHLRESFQLVGQDIVLAHAKDLDHDGDAGGRAAGQGKLDYSYYLAELRASGFEGAVVLHQLKELAPDRFDTAFQYVRDHAPAGYLG